MTRALLICTAFALAACQPMPSGPVIELTHGLYNPVSEGNGIYSVVCQDGFTANCKAAKRGICGYENYIADASYPAIQGRANYGGKWIAVTKEYFRCR